MYKQQKMEYCKSVDVVYQQQHSCNFPFAIFLSLILFLSWSLKSLTFFDWRGILFFVQLIIIGSFIMKKILTAFALAVLCAAFTLHAAAPDAANKKVLVIMLDGVRADAVLHTSMPTLNALRNGKWQKGYNCAYTDAAMVVQDAPPHSAPNHASIATGVTAAKHKVTRNGKTKTGNFQKYPHFLGHLVKQFPDLKCGFFYVWGESGYIKSNSDKVIYKANKDSANIKAACEFLKTGDAAAVYINLPDYYGHKAGFYPRNLSYMKSLTTCDNFLKQLFTTIAHRPDFAREDWLILLTADHGGYLNYHAGLPDSGNMTTIPMVIAGKSVKQGKIKGTAYTYDMAVTALAHFGIDTKKLDLDGRKLGDEVQNIPQLPLKNGLTFYYDFANNHLKFDNKTVIRETLKGFFLSAAFKNGFRMIPGSDRLKLANGNNFTLTFWARLPKQSGKDAVIIGNKDMSKPDSPGFAIIAQRLGDQQRKKDDAGICLSMARKNAKNIEFGQFNRTDGWNFYALTIDANGTMYFYNGAEDGRLYHMAYKADDAVIASKLPIYIGQDGTGKHPQGFVGELDDVAFWNRGLTREDITRIFEAGRTGMDLAMLLAE